MRITLDARVVGFPGIGRFITGLWGGLEALDADVVGLWGDGAQRGQWLGGHHAAPVGRHVAVRARPFLPLEQVSVPLALRRLGADVHHATHFNVPYAARVPVVLTVHDLIAFLDPSKARSRVAGAYYRAAFPRAIRRADVLVAGSPYAARGVAETFDVPIQDVRVIEHGIDHAHWHRRSAEAQAAARDALRLPSEYLLYVGTAKPHKNLATLYAAHADDDPPLVLVGPTQTELRAIGIDERRDGRVVPLGRVPDDVLPAIYSSATALVLPSLVEGVGLPPLEAMACGTPVVVSDGGALPETVRDAGLVVPALDVEAWKIALSRIVHDTSLREQLVRAGTHLVARRDWRDAARQYLAVYHEAASA